MKTPGDVDLERLRAFPADELVEWTFRTFGARAAIGTSFQLSGVALIDIASRSKVPFRVFTVDTLRLHGETYGLMERIERKYAVQVERFAPDPVRLEKMVRQHGEYLFFDSKAKQEYCCQIRKVEPNEKALLTVDAWITGLRRDQSARRENTAKAEWIERDGRRILKVAPLADWTAERILDYVKANDVPYSPLHDHGYPSIGCVICTTPVLPGEPPRAGRWRWFNSVVGAEDKKECGIHLEESKD